MNVEAFDITVVGGGLHGLAALHLARHGQRVPERAGA